MNELLSAALAYSVIGWPVFPLAPRQKLPLVRNPHPYGSPERSACRGRLGALDGGESCGRDGHGVLDATTDPETIYRWWTRTPDANIGLACGTTAAGDGPDVLDVDVKDGVPGLVSRERLRRAGLLSGAAAQVRTASGGEHLYYVGTTQHNGTIRKSGIDFRSAGGYVVAPPSIVTMKDGSTGMYTWTAPLRLDADRAISWEAVKSLLVPAPRWPARPKGLALAGLNAQGVRGLAAWVRGQSEGNRNAALHWACCQALESDPGADLDTIADAGRDIGLDDREVVKTVRSARIKITGFGR